MSTDIRIRPKPIFPDIQYERTANGVGLMTYVRVERNGEYYELLIKEFISFGEDVIPENEVAKCYQRLITHTYVAMHHYQIPEWQVPATDQTPEKERLEKLYPFFSIKSEKN